MYEKVIGGTYEFIYHRIIVIESFGLEEPFKIIKSNCIYEVLRNPGGRVLLKPRSLQLNNSIMLEPYYRRVVKCSECYK